MCHFLTYIIPMCIKLQGFNAILIWISQTGTFAFIGKCRRIATKMVELFDFLLLQVMSPKVPNVFKSSIIWFDVGRLEATPSFHYKL